MNDLSVLKLFKGYIGEKSDQIRKEGLKYGLLISDSASDEVFAQAVKLYGKDGEKWNQSFHKSWHKVASAPIEELVYEQLINYLTTYGFEDLGIFSHEAVYVPKEKLEIPELKEDIKLISIRAYTEEEVKDKLMSLLSSGISLSKDTISCIVDLSALIDKDRLEEVKNREARIALYDVFSMAPEDPDEFLRFVIYKTSGSTLKIQDDETIVALKTVSRKALLELFDRYLREEKEKKLRRLASIFYRNKRLFLAMKTASPDGLSVMSDLYYRIKEILKSEEDEVKEVNHLINRIRKMAVEYHQPLALNKLDRLTAPSTFISEEELKSALNRITVYRQIRILNGLLYALDKNKSIVYKIRNGKSFATERDLLDEEGYKLIEKRCEIVKQHLYDRLRPQLKDKKVYLPEDLSYKASTSEKQFVGNFPCGSAFKCDCDSDVIVGIHWTNLKAEDGDTRVDLDLHMQNLNMSFGWNSAYRDNESEIYYSGDMTDAPAPTGASELFYISKRAEDAFMFSVNNYTDNTEKIAFEVVIAKADASIDPQNIDENYVLDPNDIIAAIPMEMASDQDLMRMGFIYFENNEIRMVFDSFNGGRSIISRNDDPVFYNTFNYIRRYQKTSLSLEELFKECGVCFAEKEEADYDLSLEALNKDTIIAIFNPDK